MYQSADLTIKRALLNDFMIWTKDTHYVIECDHCKARWSLVRKSNVHSGNMLHLLNHARGHSVDAKDTENTN